MRLAGPLLMEQSDEYAIQKPNMSLESLAPMSDNPSAQGAGNCGFGLNEATSGELDVTLNSCATPRDTTG